MSGVWAIIVVAALVLMIIYWRGRNAVWGGATLGVIAGVLWKLIGRTSWNVVIKLAAIGAVSGFLAELLGIMSRRSRMESHEPPSYIDGLAVDGRLTRGSTSELEMLRRLDEYSRAYLVERRGRSEEDAASILQDMRTAQALFAASQKWLRTDFEKGERPVDLLVSRAFDSPRMDRINRLLDELDCSSSHQSVGGMGGT